MNKVILLSGSPKPEGNTFQVLHESLKVIESLGVEAELISLAGKKIQSCLACGKCAELKKCIIQDDMNDIIEKVRNAQGFIVGSPVYYGTARGDLMSALQRIGKVSGATDRFLSWKVGGPIAVARRGGQTASVQEMLMFYLMNDMIIPGSTYWNIVFGQAPGDVWKDEEGIRTIRRFSENVANLIQKIYPDPVA